jgi:hypothetical protein
VDHISVLEKLRNKANPFPDIYASEKITFHIIPIFLLEVNKNKEFCQNGKRRESFDRRAR